MIISTYSIAACDLDAGHWGVAVQSKFLSVGSVVPWAEPHVGAIATQAYANPRYGPHGLALLREGLTADEVVQRLVDADDGRDERQLGVVDGHGSSASWTGSKCNEWAGHRTGPGYAAQGNILVSAETVDALVVDDVRDVEALRAAFGEGRPVVVRADSADSVKAALARPEVSCVVVSPDHADLLALDLTELTYG